VPNVAGDAIGHLQARSDAIRELGGKGPRAGGIVSRLPQRQRVPKRPFPRAAGRPRLNRGSAAQCPTTPAVRAGMVRSVTRRRFQSRDSAEKPRASGHSTYARPEASRYTSGRTKPWHQAVSESRHSEEA
jgi:hypothetical protein